MSNCSTWPTICWQFGYKFWYTYSNTLPGPEDKSDIFSELSTSSSFLSFSQPAEREKTGGSSASAPLVIAFKSSKPFDNTQLFLWMLCLEGAHLSVVWPYKFLAPIFLSNLEFHFTEKSLTSRATSPDSNKTGQCQHGSHGTLALGKNSHKTHLFLLTCDSKHLTSFNLGSGFCFCFLSFHNCSI